MDFWAQIDDINAKLRCLLFIKDSCSEVSPEFYEKILKRAYLSFCASVKSVTWRRYDTVSFLINGLAEFYSVNPEISYTITFGILKSLAEKIKKFKERARSRQKSKEDLNASMVKGSPMTQNKLSPTTG